jgi:hypothetical protein
LYNEYQPDCVLITGKASSGRFVSPVFAGKLIKGKKRHIQVDTPEITIDLGVSASPSENSIARFHDHPVGHTRHMLETKTNSASLEATFMGSVV